MTKRKRRQIQNEPATFEDIVGWGLVACVSKSCRHTIWPKHIKSHCQTAHKMSLADSQILGDRYSDPYQYVQEPDQFQMPKSVNQAFPQLPLYTDGFLCQEKQGTCEYICRQVNGIQKHYRTEHSWKGSRHVGRRRAPKLTAPQEMPWKENVLCQRFFVNGQHSRFFKVGESDLRSSQQPQHQLQSNTDAFSTFIERGQIRLTAAKREMSGTIGDGEMDEINPWLERTQWTSKLKKLERKDLIACIAEPNEEEEPAFKEIWNAMEELIKISQDTIQHRVGHFIRMEAIRIEFNQRRYRPLQPYRDEHSLRNNMQPWQNILMFFARTQEGRKWKKIRWRFTQQQKRAWITLEICAKTSATERISGSERLQDKERQATDLEQSRDSIDTTSCPLTSLQKACLQFCISLLDQKADKDDYQCAMLWALAVLGVQESSWRGPSSYSSILSGIIKIARFFVVQKAVEDVGIGDSESERSNTSSTSSSANDNRNREEDDSQLQSIDSDTDLDSDLGSDPDINATSQPGLNKKGCIALVKDMMDAFMIRGTHGPMDWMLDVRSFAMKINFNTTNGGSVDWDGNVLLYKSLELSMPTLRSMVHGLVDETRRILVEDLMLMGKGAQRSRLPLIPWSSLRDNPAEECTGWSFLKDQRTPWPVKGDSWLCHRILADVNLKRRFQLPGQDCLDLKSIDMYMDRLTEFREKLLVLMHITGGQPARAPEILSIRHSNTPKGGIRNVFVEAGLIVFVTRYHKGYHASGNLKIIHRYLPREVGELIVWYLWLVLPWVQIIEASLGSDNQKLSMHMWPKDASGKWSSTRMRKVMMREFVIGTQVEINISSYRHIAIAISRKWLRGHTFKHDDDDEDGDWDEGGEGRDSHIADLQAGHSSHVAGITYARGIMEMTGTVADKRMAFRNTSVAWHDFLEFESARDEILSKKRPAETPLYKLEAENARIQRWKRMRTTDWIKPLQQLLGHMAEFRGLQESAIKAIGHFENPIVVVMPTGGGKSLLFMLPALCHPEGVTVVVVPLISLREDLRRRCEEIGIVCREWDSRIPPDAASIVLVTPESTATDSFATFFTRLRVTSHLDRVVIDECHILLYDDENFRPLVQNLSLLKRGRAQMIFLTATLPITLEEKLYQRMGYMEREVTIFRDKTTRRNLIYSVEQLQMRLSKHEEFEYIVRLVRRKLNGLDGLGKVIVFCSSVAQTVDLSRKLDCEAYYSNIHKSEKRWILKDFVKKREAVIVATSALGMGIDIPDIRVVIHVGKPRRLWEYAQETGRAGRDGKSSEVILIVKEEMPMSSERRSVISEEDTLVHRYVFGTQADGKPACRRIVLDEYLDGRTDRKSCEDGEAKCDICQKLQENLTALEEWNDELTAWTVYDLESGYDKSGEADDISQMCEQQDQTLDDEFHYQSRQMQLVYRREVERKGKDSSHLEKLVRALQDWSEVCSICVAMGKDGKHDFAKCRASEHVSAHSWADSVVSNIKFSKYSGCFSCGVPQALCKRWEMRPEGNGWELNRSINCQYARVVVRMLAGIYAARGSRVRERWTDRLKESKVDIDNLTDMMRYLQQKHNGEYKFIQRESNNMVWEFFWLSQQIGLNE